MKTFRRDPNETIITVLKTATCFLLFTCFLSFCSIAIFRGRPIAFAVAGGAAIIPTMLMTLFLPKWTEMEPKGCGLSVLILLYSFFLLLYGVGLAIIKVHYSNDAAVNAAAHKKVFLFSIPVIVCAALPYLLLIVHCVLRKKRETFPRSYGATVFAIAFLLSSAIIVFAFHLGDRGSLFLISLCGVNTFSMSLYGLSLISPSKVVSSKTTTEKTT